MGTKVITFCTLLLLAIPVRAQWSGYLELAGGYGRTPHKKYIYMEALNHEMLQLDARLQYEDPKWTWNTTLNGKWEPKTTDSYHITAKDEGEEAILKEKMTKPLSVGLRSDFSWKPASDRQYESWIGYRYNRDDGFNLGVNLDLNEEGSAGTVTGSYEDLEKNVHVISTGVRTRHQLGAPWKELSSSLSLDATLNQQCTEWEIVDPTEFTSESLENGQFEKNIALSTYRITPRTRNLKLSGQVHFRDSVLRGPVRLVLDPGLRFTSGHDLDQNSGANLDMEAYKRGIEIWTDSLRLRESFNYRVLQTEPYVAGDFSWQSMQVHFDYALQFYARRLNDDKHTQRMSLHGVYPVGNGSVSWRPSVRHRLSVNNRLSVTHPSYYQICWYERTGGYINQLYRGNDKLKSTVTRLYSLEYEFKPGRFTSNTTLSMTRKKNETDQTWTEAEIDGRNYKIFTWVNTADSWAFGATQRLGWNGKVISAHLGMGYNQTQRKARETGDVKKSFDWNLTGDVSAEMGQGWSFRTDARYQSKVATFFAMFGEYCVLNARLQKRFQNFTVYLEGRDLLDNVRETIYVSADETERWVESARNNRRLVVLGLKWNIR